MELVFSKSVEGAPLNTKKNSFSSNMHTKCIKNIWIFHTKMRWCYWKKHIISLYSSWKSKICVMDFLLGSKATQCIKKNLIFQARSLEMPDLLWRWRFQANGQAKLGLKNQRSSKSQFSGMQVRGGVGKLETQVTKVYSIGPQCSEVT